MYVIFSYLPHLIGLIYFFKRRKLGFITLCESLLRAIGAYYTIIFVLQVVFSFFEMISATSELIIGTIIEEMIKILFFTLFKKEHKKTDFVVSCLLFSIIENNYISFETVREAIFRAILFFTHCAFSMNFLYQFYRYKKSLSGYVKGLFSAIASHLIYNLLTLSQIPFICFSAYVVALEKCMLSELENTPECF